MDWLNELLQQTGEFGQSAGTLEGGFNAALSGTNTMTTPDWLQSLLQQTGESGQSAATLEGGFNSALGTAGGGGIWEAIRNATGLENKDLLRMGGQLGAAGLGAYGANQQAKSLQGLSDKYSEFGAPYRAMLAQSYADPSGFLANSPDIKAAVQQGTDATSRALSVNGNPAGSGRALQEMQNYATQGLYGQLGNERQRLANFGGLSAMTGSAPQLATSAIGQQGNVLNALGYGINQVTNPTPSLNDLWKSLNLGGLA